MADLIIRRRLSSSRFLNWHLARQHVVCNIRNLLGNFYNEAVPLYVDLNIVSPVVSKLQIPLCLTVNTAVQVLVL